MTTKKYYWLKLPDNFFEDKSIKKLRRIAGGDTYTVIYLKMLLKSLKDGGKIYYDGIEDSVAEEIALELDEDPDNVMVTLNFLKRYGLLQESGDDVMLTQLPAMVGSESAAAERMRRSREKKKLEPATSNHALPQSTTDSGKCNIVTPELHHGYVEKEIDKEIDKEIEGDKKPKRKRFVPPTLEEVASYCRERNNTVDPQHWHDYYSSNGWKVGKNPMKDWKSAVRTWERNGFSNSNQNSKTQSRAGSAFRDIQNSRSYDYDDLQKRLGGFG